MAQTIYQDTALFWFSKTKTKTKKQKQKNKVKKTVLSLPSSIQIVILKGISYNDKTGSRDGCEMGLA